MAGSARWSAPRWRRSGAELVVIETSEDGLEKARRDGAEVFIGNAADPEILAAANLAAARRLFVTIPEAFEAGQVVQQARAINPTLEILARAHSDAAVEHLERPGRQPGRAGRARDRRAHARAGRHETDVAGNHERPFI